jgi:hypothetical protein
LPRPFKPQVAADAPEFRELLDAGELNITTDRAEAQGLCVLNAQITAYPTNFNRTIMDPDVEIAANLVDTAG